MSEKEEKFLQSAIMLSRRNLGQTWPNPTVGCLIVKEGIIVGRGVTAKGGRPHAETLALQMAGDKARGADMYVSLEPCSHHGETPPCVDAIIKAGIARVIVAAIDPDKRVSGGGLASLKKHGVQTELIKMDDNTNAGFYSSITRKRPYIALKIATGVDGRLALSNGISRWITGVQAREYSHMLRSKFDALLTGIGTVLVDDPELTCRLPGLEGNSPVRVVLDSELALPKGSRLVKTREKSPLWVFGRNAIVEKVWNAKGIKLSGVREDFAGLDLTEVLNALAADGITRLMVEAGPRITTSFLKSGLVDYIYWFRAPKIIGGEGLSAVGDLNLSSMEEIKCFKRTCIKQLGDDVLEEYMPQCSPE